MSLEVRIMRASIYQRGMGLYYRNNLSGERARVSYENIGLSISNIGVTIPTNLISEFRIEIELEPKGLA